VCDEKDIWGEEITLKEILALLDVERNCNMVSVTELVPQMGIEERTP
jgi:hypothetical protein